MEKIRNLRPEEIAHLQSQGCHAENWGQVLVPVILRDQSISITYASQAQSF